jgi:allantoate deiminase
MAGQAAIESPIDRARRILARADELAAISETSDGLVTRTFGSEAMRRANASVAGWMSGAGLETRTDAIGNLRGMQPRDGRPLLLLGSHLDTVREAGRFDGILGVLVGLACAEAAAAGAYGALPYRLGAVGFSDEEGVRFQTAYLGSEVLAGTFDPTRLGLVDADGISIAEAIKAFGGDPGALASERLDVQAEGGLLGYCEVHIEQGPVLESRDLPVGVVSAIAGQSRFAFRFEGRAGHAGTTPMGLRLDALAAAAEFIHAVELRALGDPGLVATVGQLAIKPGASNVIAGSAAGSLDVRSARNPQRLTACADLARSAAEIAKRRGLRLEWRLAQEHPATPCDPALRGLLIRAVEGAGMEALELPSGAGHDAVALAAALPVAMLFVRCRDGLSHHPEESVQLADVACALKVMDNFLSLLATSPRLS